MPTDLYPLIGFACGLLFGLAMMGMVWAGK